MSISGYCGRWRTVLEFKDSSTKPARTAVRTAVPTVLPLSQRAQEWCRYSDDLVHTQSGEDDDRRVQRLVGASGAERNGPDEARGEGNKQGESRRCRPSACGDAHSEQDDQEDRRPEDVTGAPDRVAVHVETAGRSDQADRDDRDREVQAVPERS